MPVPISPNSRGSPRQGNVVPVYRTIVADLLSPVSAFLSLSPQHGRESNSHPHSFLLESVEGGERVGRYTFFGVDPFQIVSCRGDRITVRRGEAVAAVSDRRSGGRRPPLQEETGNIFEFLRHLGARYHSVEIPGLPPFTAGAVGYLSYEAVRMLERLPAARPRRRRFGRRGLHVFFQRAGL